MSKQRLLLKQFFKIWSVIQFQRAAEAQKVAKLNKIMFTRIMLPAIIVMSQVQFVTGILLISA